MEKLKSVLEIEVSKLRSNILDCKTKLDENYVYHFQWGLPQALYMASLEEAILSQFIGFLADEPERAEEWLNYNIKRISHEILEGSFLGTSTSAYSNMAHTYKKEVDCILLKKYQQYLRIITPKKQK